MLYQLYLLCLSLYLKTCFADTPANCTYEDARGRWLFETCTYPQNCTGHPEDRFVFDLLYPNTVDVITGYGTFGTWTMIYNQGFEVTVAHRKWLVMFAFDSKGESFCDRGIPNWSHDSLIRQKLWFTARKISPKVSPGLTSSSESDKTWFNTMFKTNRSFIQQINTIQTNWQAVHYPYWDELTYGDVLRRVGGFKSMFPRPKELIDRSRAAEELVLAAKTLPESFDWRFTDGRAARSPVTAVRNQLRCGSCYAFASAGALEARIRIASNFSHQPKLSPQSIVDCSPYSEGCNGGFPYLIAGKHAEVYGFPVEDCDPYTGEQAASCPVKSDCTRYYATNYHYVGGYYGACSELAMKMELVYGGPIPIGFQVYDDFLHYKSGVYQRTRLARPVNRFEPFELTNHAVLLVGYGVDENSNLPYWSVKNSWGTEWGEYGFFRILRGSDECGVESLAVAFDPVL